MTRRLPRVALCLIGIVGVFTGHLALTLAIVIADAVVFAGLESVVLGLIFDLMWTEAPLHAVPWVTLCALAMLWASEPIRREILH